MELQAALVRQQLKAYGFENVPDEVLRQMLNELDEMRVDDSAPPVDKRPPRPSSAGITRDEDTPIDAATWAALRPSSCSGSLRRVSTTCSLAAGSSAARIRVMDSRPSPAKSDPVRMHAQRSQQWRDDSFLTKSPRRNVPIYSPAPTTKPQSRRRPPPSYVVPTAKRRDDVIWETRQRMRQMNESATPRRPSRKDLGPNSFVPCTDKRRDGLRWQVRAQMAWTH